MNRKLVAVVVLQAIGLTILAALLPTWQDEEFTLASTVHGVGYAIHRALFYEHQGPFYFALVAALRPISQSVFFAREISVAFVVGMTLVAAPLARAIWPQRDPSVFCALLALNPFAIFAAVEIRLYALALLLGAALFLCFFRGFFDGDDRRARIGFALCATVAMYTQYFAALDIAGCCAALAVLGRRRSLLACIGTSFVPLIAFLPMTRLLAQQASGAMSLALAVPPGFGGRFLRPIDFIFASHYTTISRPADAIAKLAKIASALAIVVAFPRLNRRFLALLGIAIFTHVAYASVEVLSHRALSTPRHFVALFFPEAIALYALVSLFSGARGRVAAGTIAIALAASDIAVLTSTYAPLTKPGDARRVGAYLTANARNGDVIAVYPGDAAPAIARYYAGAAHVVGYPESLSSTRYSVDEAWLHSERAAADAFAALPRADRLWFVEVGTCGVSDALGCAEVDRAARVRFRILAAHTTNGTTIVEYLPKRRSP